MKKLISIAILSLGLTGFAAADDRGDFSWVEPTAGQPFDGQTLGRAGHPVPMPTTSNEDGMANVAIERNGRA